MNDEQPANEQGQRDYVPLEEGRRLSESLLWDLQRRYFSQAGMAAWSEGVVPMWVTSNPLIARIYARVAAAWLRDLDEAASPPRRPVYFVELGAGAGRFAFNFLRSFTAAPDAARPPFTYVMTENNPALLDFWQAHPALAPFVAAGQLDFAFFDAVQPGDLALRVSGTSLAPQTDGAGTPVVLIANYFFDSIPVDAFYLDQGRLHESLASVLGPPGTDAMDPAQLGRLRLSYEHRPAADRYYGEPLLDELLDDYRQDFDATALAFPAAGLRCLDYFRRLARGDLLLLSSDKGYYQAEDVRGRREPGFEVHGSFSMGVNYHALGRYFVRRGGAALYPPYPHLYLATCAFLLGSRAAAWRATQQAYLEALGDFSPEDYYLALGVLEGEHAALKVEQVLALLKLSGWDSRLFQTCFADLFAGLSTASPAVLEQLRAAIGRVWAGYYAIGESYDLPYDLAILLYKLGDYPAALVYFMHSLALHGPGAKTLYNMALCHYCLHDRDAAVSAARQAAGLDPAFEPARALERRIERELMG